MSTLEEKIYVNLETWLAALASSACIGCTSLVPWLFNMTFFERHQQLEGQPNEDRRMIFLLSFSVGAILGDIFFHLIPESFQSHINELNDTPKDAHRKVGLSIVAGIFMFIIVEMILDKWSHPISTDESLNESKISNQDKHLDNLAPIFNNKDLKRTLGSVVNYDNSRDAMENNNTPMSDLNEFYINNFHTKSPQRNPPDNFNKLPEPDVFTDQREKDALLQLNSGTKRFLETSDRLSSAASGLNFGDTTNKTSGVHIIETAGYLSLMANGFDNFTHGLAIGASFLVGAKVGLLTTFVIFIHEIPHEICDYAILVNAGFSRWDAVKAQSSVSLFGILGTATALYVKSVDTLTAKTVWILPFSAGGFLYIALVNLLPEILDRKTNPRHSFGQVACVIFGIAIMAIIAVI